MQLRHLRLEIFLTFSYGFRVLEAHFLIKKRVSLERKEPLIQIAFFIIFKGLSVAKNCLRPESVPLMFFRETELGHKNLGVRIFANVKY